MMHRTLNPNRGTGRSLSIAVMLFCSSVALHGQNVIITKTQDLAFGAIIKSQSQSGTVTISTSGTRTKTGGVYLLPAGYGSYMEASFSVQLKHSRNDLIIIQLPSSITVSSGSSTMTVNNFVSNPASGFYSPSNNYNFTLDVGARLNVAAGQASGTYTGTFTVTVIKQ